MKYVVYVSCPYTISALSKVISTKSGWQVDVSKQKHFLLLNKYPIVTSLHPSPCMFMCCILSTCYSGMHRTKHLCDTIAPITSPISPNTPAGPYLMGIPYGYVTKAYQMCFVQSSTFKEGGRFNAIHKI